jgi:hypothetical protein
MSAYFKKEWQKERRAALIWVNGAIGPKME